MRKRNHLLTLTERFPPSEKCQCDICLSFCNRPGWWSVEQAYLAFKAGYAEKMMLEISPEHTFGVLSPSFKGCEGNFAYQEFAKNKCTFLSKNLCELYGSEFVPLECQFCHHTRLGFGPQCHTALEKDWKTEAGQKLVEQWARSFYKWEIYKKIVGIDDKNSLSSIPIHRPHM